MKYQGEHFYFYLGWDGLIIALSFCYRKKFHDLQLALTHASIEDEDE